MRALFSIFDHEGRHVQALAQSLSSRSFKLHVWAEYRFIDAVETTELKYLGTIQPIDQTDNAEVEFMIQELFMREYPKLKK